MVTLATAILGRSVSAAGLCCSYMRTPNIIFPATGAAVAAPAAAAEEEELDEEDEEEAAEEEGVRLELRMSRRSSRESGM